MLKTANISELEQTIETLPQADQFRLLEKLLKQLKHSLFGTKPSVSEGLPSKTAGSLRGTLKQYASPALVSSEEDAFARAMKVKHANS